MDALKDAFLIGWLAACVASWAMPAIHNWLVKGLFCGCVFVLAKGFAMGVL